MFLSSFLHGRPLIWLDHKTGQWRPATESEAPADKSLVDLEIDQGTYLDEGEIRYFKYWSDDRKNFFFRTSEGTVIEIDGRNNAQVGPAKDSAGKDRSGFNEFKILDQRGQVLFVHIYDASPYVSLFEMDFSFPESRIEDWDFFLSLKASFDYMQAKIAETPESPGRVYGGDACPREGVWFTPAKEKSRQYFREGDAMPVYKTDYGATIWQWDSNQSPPLQSKNYLAPPKET